MAWQVLVHTPGWVFLALAAVLWLGLNALRRRWMSPVRLFLFPAVLIVWGLTDPGFWHRHAAAWFAYGALGIALGFWLTPPEGYRFDPARGIEVPGSLRPLAIGLAKFASLYAVGVALALQSPMLPTFRAVALAVSGLAAGFAIGRVARILNGVRRLPGS